MGFDEGIRLHKRMEITNKADCDFLGAALDIEKKYGLTPPEIVRMLLGVAMHYINYTLRYERHGTYDKKADEA